MTERELLLTDDWYASTSEVARVRRFIGDRCALSPSLVVPFAVLAKAYREWAEPASTTSREIRAVLEAAPWAEVKERQTQIRMVQL